MSTAPTLAPVTDEEPLIFGADHAARILGVAGRKQVYRWVKERGLPYVALGERRLGFTRAGLERWTADQEQVGR